MRVMGGVGIVELLMLGAIGVVFFVFIRRWVSRRSAPQQSAQVSPSDRPLLPLSHDEFVATLAAAGLLARIGVNGMRNPPPPLRAALARLASVSPGS